MKKFSILLCAVLCACTVFAFPGAVSAEKAEKTAQTVADYPVVSQDRISAYFDDFVEKNKNRTLGTTGEKAAAEYIAEQFYNFKLTNYFGLSAVDFEDKDNISGQKAKYLQEFAVTQNDKAIYGNNVAGYIPAANAGADTVIIGAHLDNVYEAKKSESEMILGHGAYDNGSGIAVLLALAEAITRENFSSDFNIVFVAFSAEETGLNGSQEFVEKMKSDRLSHFENMLIMFNLDVVGPGDYLYLYTDEVKTQHGEYLHEIADSLDIATIKRPPADKKVLPLGGYYKDVSYTHTAMMSDSAVFHNEGKNTAFFFSMNWDTYKKVGTVESETHPAIMHTSNDTLETIKEYYGDTYLSYMAAAANTISSAVSGGDQFVSVMKSSAENRINYTFWTNSLWAVLICIGIFLIVSTLLILWYFKLKKVAPKPKVTAGYGQNVKVTPVVTNEMPPADDIFGFGGNEPQKRTPTDPAEQDRRPMDPFDDFYK